MRVDDFLSMRHLFSRFETVNLRPVFADISVCLNDAFAATAAGGKTVGVRFG